MTFLIRSILVLVLVSGASSSWAQSLEETINYHQQALENSERRLDELEAQLRSAVNTLDQMEETRTQEVVYEFPATEQNSVQEVEPVYVQAPIPVVAPVETYRPQAQSLPVHRTKLSAEFSNIKYREKSLDMTEKGPFFGVMWDYAYRPESARDWLFNVYHSELHANIGQVDYSSPSGEFDGITDYMFEPRFWVGRDFSLGPNTFTPYIGIGYRQLVDKLGEVEDGGYDRRSQYLYAPIGFEFISQALSGWELGINGEFDIFIRGRQSSYLSDVDSDLPDLHNPQTKGYGVRASVDLIKKLDRVNLLISPYMRFWYIKQSKTRTASTEVYEVTGYEPTNKSMEIGLRTGVQF